MAKKLPTVLREIEEAAQKLNGFLPDGGEIQITWTIDIFVGQEPYKGIHGSDVILVVKGKKSDE